MAFSGTLNGAVQTAVFDNTGIGFEGQLYTNGDPNLIDGFPVEATPGVYAGRGVVKGTAVTIPTDKFGNLKAPYQVKVPEAGSTFADFVGIAVRAYGMSSDDTGNNLWEVNKMASIVRKGRICVLATETVVAGDDVYLYIQDTLTHGNPIGTFSKTSTADTIQITNARWYLPATAGDIGVIELGL